METGPAAFDVRIVAHQLVERMDLGVQIVEVVQGHGFERHRQLGAAVFVLAVMADDHVLQPQHELVGHGFAGEPLGLAAACFPSMPTAITTWPISWPSSV